MITTELYGRMGNQMFQIAATIGYATKHGMEWNVPRDTQNNRSFPPRFTHLINPKYDVMLPQEEILENGHAYQEIPFYEDWKEVNYIMDGYWQSELYFKHAVPQVLEAFNLPWEAKKDKVSIHIRRTDYLVHADKHPPVAQDYLEPAMLYFAQRGYTKFMVFGDDPKWNQENLNSKKYPQYEFEYSPNLGTVEDMVLMSECENGHIIANSSYSWWGAYLNQNPQKIIVTPSKDNWFGPGNANLSAKTIIPSDWVQIKY